MNHSPATVNLLLQKPEALWTVEAEEDVEAGGPAVLEIVLELKDDSQFFPKGGEEFDPLGREPEDERCSFQGGGEEGSGLHREEIERVRVREEFHGLASGDSLIAPASQEELGEAELEGGGVGGLLENLGAQGDESVSGEKGQPRREGLVEGGLPSSQVIVVQKRQVVVYQLFVVYHLDRGRPRENPLL